MSEVVHEPAASFQALSRLAVALARPFTSFPDARFDVSPLGREQIEKLRSQPGFRRPLERLFYFQIAGKPLTISRRQAECLPETTAGRLAILMLTEALAQVEQAALLVSAGAMHRQVLATMPRQQREHIRNALGAEAFLVATLEAPMLYPSLGAYANDKLFATILFEHEEAARASLVNFGVRLLCTAVSPASRPLALLALKRFHTKAGLGVKSLSTNDMRSLTRLFQRRMSRWAAFIG